MKTSCEIIKDLLPLFYDGVCSNESRAMVEEHIAECDNCKGELQSMGTTIPATSIVQNMDEAEAIKKLSQTWKKGIKQSFLKGAMITFVAILAILMVAFILYLFIDIRPFYPY